MLTYNKEESNLKIDTIVNKIDDGALFVYPTDTIYGIGCDATNEEAVKKLRDLKNFHDKPLSIIVPDKRWIRDNCEVEKNAIEWLTKIPGPYTLIFNLKEDAKIAPNVTNTKTIGVRMIDHWTQKVCELFDRPIITTAANKLGGNIMTSPDEIDTDIKAHVEFLIDGGNIKGRPSTLVNLSKDSEEITKR